MTSYLIRASYPQYFLAVFVSLQLAVFFLLVAMCLWIDQLINGTVADISSHTAIYQALFIFTTVVCTVSPLDVLRRSCMVGSQVLLPWIATVRIHPRLAEEVLMSDATGLVCDSS